MQSPEDITGVSCISPLPQFQAARLPLPVWESVPGRRIWNTSALSGKNLASVCSETGGTRLREGMGGGKRGRTGSRAWINLQVQRETIRICSWEMATTPEQTSLPATTSSGVQKRDRAIDPAFPSSLLSRGAGTEHWTVAHCLTTLQFHNCSQPCSFPQRNLCPPFLPSVGSPREQQGSGVLPDNLYWTMGFVTHWSFSNHYQGVVPHSLSWFCWDLGCFLAGRFSPTSALRIFVLVPFPSLQKQHFLHSMSLFFSSVFGICLGSH